MALPGVLAESRGATLSARRSAFRLARLPWQNSGSKAQPPRRALARERHALAVAVTAAPRVRSRSLRASQAVLRQRRGALAELAAQLSGRRTSSSSSRIRRARAGRCSATSDCVRSSSSATVRRSRLTPSTCSKAATRSIPASARRSSEDAAHQRQQRVRPRSPRPSRAPRSSIPAAARARPRRTTRLRGRHTGAPAARRFRTPCTPRLPTARTRTWEVSISPGKERPTTSTSTPKRRRLPVAEAAVVKAASRFAKPAARCAWSASSSRASALRR